MLQDLCFKIEEDFFGNVAAVVANALQIGDDLDRGRHEADRALVFDTAAATGLAGLGRQWPGAVTLVAKPFAGLGGPGRRDRWWDRQACPGGRT